MKICGYCGKRIRRSDHHTEIDGKTHYHRVCYFLYMRKKKRESELQYPKQDIENYCKYCEYLDNFCKESLPPENECIPECKSELEKILIRIGKKNESRNH